MNNHKQGRRTNRETRESRVGTSKKKTEWGEEIGCAKIGGRIVKIANNAACE